MTDGFFVLCILGIPGLALICVGYIKLDLPECFGVSRFIEVQIALCRRAVFTNFLSFCAKRIATLKIYDTFYL